MPTNVWCPCKALRDKGNVFVSGKEIKGAAWVSRKEWLWLCSRDGLKNADRIAGGDSYPCPWAPGNSPTPSPREHKSHYMEGHFQAKGPRATFQRMAPTSKVPSDQVTGRKPDLTPWCTGRLMNRSCIGTQSLLFGFSNLFFFVQQRNWIKNLECATGCMVCIPAGSPQDCFLPSIAP